MKKVLLLTVVLCMFATQSIAAEVNAVGVVTGGRISVTGSYFAYSGAVNPAYQNQSEFKVYGIGNLGVADKGVYSGALANQQQIEVNSGYASFLSKVGRDFLTTATDEQTGVKTGTLFQNAIGFSGFLDKEGLVTMGFNTAGDNGFTGLLDGKGTGIIKAGAVGVTTTGSTTPIIVESSNYHIVIGPGQFQTQISFTFPRVGE